MRVSVLLLCVLIAGCGRGVDPQAHDCDWAWSAIESRAANIGPVYVPPTIKESDVLGILGAPDATKTYTDGHYIWRWSVVSSGDVCGKYLARFGYPAQSGYLVEYGPESKFAGQDLP